jgi:hypothetical protein
MSRRLYLYEKVRFLEKAHATGKLPEHYSQLRRTFSESLQEAIWRPLGERVQKAIAVTREDQGYGKPERMEKAIREIRWNAADAEFRNLAQNAVELSDFANDQRRAEEVLEIWRKRERDLNDLPEEVLRSRLFVRLANEDITRATELLDASVSADAREEVVTEAAENLVNVQQELKGALDFLESTPFADEGVAYQRRSFATNAIHLLHDEVSPQLVKNLLENRPASLERDYLAAGWATWMKQEGGEMDLILDFEGMVKTPEARQAYEQQKINVPR